MSDNGNNLYFFVLFYFMSHSQPESEELSGPDNPITGGATAQSHETEDNDQKDKDEEGEGEEGLENEEDDNSGHIDKCARGNSDEDLYLD